MLTTSRLLLRRLVRSDEPAMVAIDSDPEVMRYVGSPRGTCAPEETRERARQRIASDHGAAGWWAIQGRADSVFHGLALLLPMPDGDDFEVGYRLARRSWGQGIATEAAAAVVRHGFAALGLPRVVAVAYPENAPSRRVLEKLGFTYDGAFDYRGAAVVRYVLDRPAPRPA